MIYILSEELQSGKTTSLQLCTENRYDVGGFLSPDKCGSRCLMNLKSKKEVPFEIDITEYEQDIEVIGKFTLAKSAFSTGEQWVKDHLNDDSINFVVIDEIGKLELEGKGFSSLLHFAIENIGQKNLIIVVRKSLLSEIQNKFNLGGSKALRLYDVDKLFQGQLTP